MLIIFFYVFDNILVGRGLLLHQVDTLTLEDVEQCLTALQDFHVRSFRLLNSLVVLRSGLLLPLKRFVNLRQALSQDGKVLLDLRLLLCKMFIKKMISVSPARRRGRERGKVGERDGGTQELIPESIAHS